MLGHSKEWVLCITSTLLSYQNLDELFKVLEPWHLLYGDSQDQYHQSYCITAPNSYGIYVLDLSSFIQVFPSCYDAKEHFRAGHISSIFGLPRISLVPCISLELLDLVEPNAAL